MWHMRPKPVDESQANHSDVRDQDTADMGDTCVESKQDPEYTDYKYWKANGWLDKVRPWKKKYG